MEPEIRPASTDADIAAHRFYAREGLDGGSLHFMKRLREER